MKQEPGRIGRRVQRLGDVRLRAVPLPYAMSKTAQNQIGFYAAGALASAGRAPTLTKAGTTEQRLCAAAWTRSTKLKSSSCKFVRSQYRRAPYAGVKPSRAGCVRRCRAGCAAAAPCINYAAGRFSSSFPQFPIRLRAICVPRPPG